MKSQSCFFISLVATCLALAWGSEIPKCYINIAGPKLFAFFAPIDVETWLEVKVDGTWGDNRLMAHGTKAYLSNLNFGTVLESGYPVWWEYSSTTNCIKSGIMYYDANPIAPGNPRTYGVPLVEPTVRILPGVILTQNVQTVSQPLAELHNMFKPKDYNAYRQQYSGFFWYHDDEKLTFVTGNEVKGEYKSASEGKYFYGIFEKPNEFLLPGRYSELLPLRENVASGGDCVTLAKRLGHKRVSYNVKTKNCYYADKEGIYDSFVTDWTCAPVNV